METMSFYSLKLSSIGMLLLPLLFLGAPMIDLPFASYALWRQSFVLFTIFLHVLFRDCN
ncbi:hypothetical protein CLU79DRAFT_726167 [Phycomyces nitens]|nr:hypothetical protein CLU79DRAFT_726167 [Phycomyces nitens]